MNEVLTFRAPQSSSPRVVAMPSPALELAYAYYRVQRRDVGRSFSELPWLETLHATHPELVAAVQRFWGEDGREAGFDLFWFVCEMGFALHEDVAPLFRDFAVALDGFVERVRAHHERMQGDGDDEAPPQKYVLLMERLGALRDPGTQQRFLGLLRELWAALSGLWQSEGLTEARRAAELFTAKFAASGEVLESLPAHHFVQFEGSVQEIRRSLERGRLVVVPLFFAAAGGFNLDFADTHFLGYGIHSDSEFGRLQARSDELAPRLKALGDPTRLLLLTLLARYTNFVLTVSDLAHQVGVSQPTVSAHLKLLKDNGLVTLERHGNKSFYRPEAAALEAALGELRELLRLD